MWDIQYATTNVLAMLTVELADFKSRRIIAFKKNLVS